MKKAIYTAVIDNYDEVVKPLYVNPDYDYILFTNMDIDSDFWQVRKVEGNGVKLARKIKIRPDLYLTEYDLSVWLDANIIQKSCMNALIWELLQGSDMLTMKHPNRQCIYDEVGACHMFGKDNLDLMIKQVERYKAEGYPRDNGLIASGILARKHNKKVIDLMKAWWYEVQEYSHRDQLSFNYCLSKSNINLLLIPYNVLRTHFLYTRHK